MTDDNIYAPPTAALDIESEEESALASRGARFGGALIDLVVNVSVIFPAMYFSGYWERAMAQQVDTLEVIMAGVGGFVIFIVVHGYLLATSGQTIGKRLVGTRIVSNDGNETLLPLWKIVSLRYLPASAVGQIPYAGGFLGLVNVLFIFRQDRRCVHDWIAGTKVVAVKK